MYITAKSRLHSWWHHSVHSGFHGFAIAETNAKSSKSRIFRETWKRNSSISNRHCHPAAPDSGSITQPWLQTPNLLLSECWLFCGINIKVGYHDKLNAGCRTRRLRSRVEKLPAFFMTGFRHAGNVKNRSWHAISRKNGTRILTRSFAIWEKIVSRKYVSDDRCTVMSSLSVSC